MHLCTIMLLVNMWSVSHKPQSHQWWLSQHIPGLQGVLLLVSSPSSTNMQWPVNKYLFRE